MLHQPWSSLKSEDTRKRTYVKLNHLPLPQNNGRGTISSCKHYEMDKDDFRQRQNNSRL